MYVAELKPEIFLMAHMNTIVANPSAGNVDPFTLTKYPSVILTTLILIVLKN